jgi:hypothetical protein
MFKGLIFNFMHKSMTKSFNLILRLLLFLLVFNTPVKSQITIGSLSDPQGGALLDLKEKDTAGTDADMPNSNKGVLFPKVSLQAATSLEPLFSVTADPQTKTSKGMIVYNVNKNAAGVNVGLCVWTGEEWSALVGGGPVPRAKFDIRCTPAITVSGNYVRGNPLNPYTHVITVPVEVTQKGSYNIVAYSYPDNQYYFESKGEFFNTGNFNVTLNGMGTPRESTLDRSSVPDTIKIFVNGTEYASTQCPNSSPLTLKIDDSSPDYYFSCKQIDISNVKLQTNTASTGSYITIRLQVPKEATGAKYHIKTNPVDSIIFEGSGNLVAGQQTVVLASNGKTPKTPGMHSFYFISNSADPRLGNCPVEIPITGRSVKVALWSESGSVWDLNSQADGVKRILESSKLFGLGVDSAPLCPVAAINTTFSTPNAFPASLPNDLDIAILSYDSNPDGAMATTLAKFVQDGGVVIQCTEGGRSMALPDLIFGKGVVTKYSQESGSNDPAITLLPGNPLVNGAYMNIEKEEMGYDGGSNLGFNTNDPNGVVEVVGLRKLDDKPTVIKHKTWAYVLCGDGGLFAGTTNPTAAERHPLQVSSEGLPVARTTGRYASLNGAYNAHFFVNMMIWAINYRLAIKP